jgi:hypothetical protein
MFAKIDQSNILSSYYKIREHCLLTMRHNLCEDSKRHLHRGMLIRLGMMEECVIVLDEELSKARAPLDSYLSIRLTLLLIVAREAGVHDLSGLYRRKHKAQGVSPG